METTEEYSPPTHIFDCGFHCGKSNEYHPCDYEDCSLRSCGNLHDALMWVFETMKNNNVVITGNKLYHPELFNDEDNRGKLLLLCCDTKNHRQLIREHHGYLRSLSIDGLTRNYRKFVNNK